MPPRSSSAALARSHPLAAPQRGFTSGEARLAFEVKDAAARLELLGTLFAFCRQAAEAWPLAFHDL